MNKDQFTTSHNNRYKMNWDEVFGLRVNLEAGNSCRIVWYYAIMLCVLGHKKCVCESCKVAGAPPPTPMRELTVLP